MLGFVKKILFFSSVILLCSCSKKNSTDDNNKADQGTHLTLNSIKLSQSDTAVQVGKILTVVATGDYSNSSGKHYNLTIQPKWTSSDTTVASISEFGEITGIAEGSTVITASEGGKESNFKLSVTKQDPKVVLESMKLQSDSFNIDFDGHVSLKATGHYSDQTFSDIDSQKISWKSENPSIATVNEEGFVKTVSCDIVSACENVRKVTITAEYKDNTTIATSATITIYKIQFDNMYIIESNHQKTKDDKYIYDLNARVDFQAFGRIDKSDTILPIAVKWSSSNSDVIDIENTDLPQHAVSGQIKNIGSAIIEAVYRDDILSASEKIDITQPKLSSFNARSLVCRKTPEKCDFEYGYDSEALIKINVGDTDIISIDARDIDNHIRKITYFTDGEVGSKYFGYYDFIRYTVGIPYDVDAISLSPLSKEDGYNCPLLVPSEDIRNMNPYRTCFKVKALRPSASPAPCDKKYPVEPGFHTPACVSAIEFRYKDGSAKEYRKVFYYRVN